MSVRQRRTGEPPAEARARRGPILLFTSGYEPGSKYGAVAPEGTRRIRVIRWPRRAVGLLLCVLVAFESVKRSYGFAGERRGPCAKRAAVAHARSAAGRSRTRSARGVSNLQRSAPASRS